MNSSDFFVTEEDTLACALERINTNLLKIALVLRDNKLVGVIGDGDIRRALMRGVGVESLVSGATNYSPIYIFENQRKNAYSILNKKKIGVLPVLNSNFEVIDILTSEKVYQINKRELSVPVVIMAGGKGTRLYPYTKILPKPLIPIGELPIVEHIMNRFWKFGCSEFYMIVNYKKNMIHSYFDYVSHEYTLTIVDEEEALGTGGGLSLLKKENFEHFFMTNCDILIDADYNMIYKAHMEQDNFITIICAKKQNKIPYGVVIVDKNNDYEGMEEKPSYEVIINTGVYIVNGRVIRELEDKKDVNFPDIIEHYRMLGEKIGVYIIEEAAFMDMGQMEELDDMWKRMEGIKD